MVTTVTVENAEFYIIEPEFEGSVVRPQSSLIRSMQVYSAINTAETRFSSIDNPFSPRPKVVKDYVFSSEPYVLSVN